MGKYSLVFKKSVAKDLRAIPRKDVARILKCVEALSEDPRGPGCEKLSGQERYRVRQGVYRIIYEIEDDKLVILIVRVGHRGEVYGSSYQPHSAGGSGLSRRLRGTRRARLGPPLMLHVGADASRRPTCG